MPLKRPALVSALMLGSSLLVMAVANTALAADTGATAGPSAPAAPAGPDLGALRFYMAQHDQPRIAAEIHLLRAKFPTWQPPTDLSADTAPDNQEQPLWDLFAKHDLEGLKAAIAERRRQAPDWQPSADLGAKLALAEAGKALVQAHDRKDYGTVVDIAAANDGLISCANVDAIWRTAEALVRTNDEPHAIDAYRYILTNCTVAQERLATVQKAAALLKSPQAVNGLLQMGVARPDGTSEFASVEVDGLRQRVGRAAAGETTIQPSAADLDRLATRARAADGVKDAELLGWYALSRKDFNGAATWFQTVMRTAPTAKAAEGLVLALRDVRMAEAVKLATAYANLGPQNRKLMMETLAASLNEAKVTLSASQLAMLAAAIDTEKSADAAQTLGWSRFKAKDIKQAEAWFTKSMAWQPNQPAAIGLMLAAKRLGHAADYAAIVKRYKATYARVAELDGSLKSSSQPAKPAVPSKGGAPQVARPAQPSKGGAPQVAGKDGGWDKEAATIVKTFENGQVDKALVMLDARKATHAEPKGLSIVRGWALYKKGDWDGAKKVFTSVNKDPGDDAARGLRQIEIGYTNPRYR